MTLSVDPQIRLTAVDLNSFAAGDILLTVPATESQKEIWASAKMGEDANCAYNESRSLRLWGALNTEVLRTALQELVQRHEALRMSFSPDGRTLCISASLQIEIPRIDLSDLDRQEQETRVAGILRQEVEQPFDLEHGPLFRVQIIKLQPQEHLVLLTVHQIICDGWSWGVLMPDLGKLYSALVQGITPDLEAPYSFSEYALLQEKEANSDRAIATEKYWLNQFSNSIPVLDLPTPRPRPPVRTFNCAREDWELDPTLVANLKQLGAKLDCSFAMTVVAAFEVLLYRLTGQEDIVVGIGADLQAVGRSNLVGHCVSLLPVRSHINVEQSFSDYLQARRSVLLDAYNHQPFTFKKLVKKLALPQDSSRTLVPVIINVEQGLGDSLQFDGLEVELFSNSRSKDNFELCLNVAVGSKSTLEFQYNTNLFDADTIRRRMAEFETLLAGIIANPDQCIAKLPILPEAEQQLLAAWNCTQAYPQDKCIHQLFEAQVERTPDAIAVVFEDKHLTYRELNLEANRLAHYLQQLGVGTEMLVGLCVERSIEMIVGILGILKAGAAYLPLDPAYPQDRIGFMLEDGKVAVLLTQERLLETLPSHSAKVVCLDTDKEAIAQNSHENAVSQVESSNLAYVIYTSGSTGKPKGVLVSHANVARLFSATQPWYHFNEQDVWSLFHSYAFDFSVWEIWGALLYGGRLVVVSYWNSRSPEAFYKLLCKEQVTVLNQTPSAFRQLIAAEESCGIANNLNLRLVIFGGEALEIPSLKPWFERHGDKRPQLVNMYGITETTVHVTYRPLTIADLNGRGSVIGKPIPDLQVYVLDQHRQPVPIDVPGEMYIGGAGLARGYFNRPELTADRFIVNSFSDDPNARLYKSGDLARYLPNGDIEYLGRIDHQVKIRGFRIELGEIATALEQHSAVLEAVVIAREDEPGNKRLVAYIVLSQEKVPTASELRSFLKEKLPEYMVPASFVMLDAIPLTSNGKVDRKALPMPELASLAEDYVAPRNPIEQQIADIWASVLNLERVGIHNNFFELGGHSMLAIQIISRLRRDLQVELSLPILFEAPNVADLAKRVETLNWAVQKLQVQENNTVQDYEEGEL